MTELADLHTGFAAEAAATVRQSKAATNTYGGGRDQTAIIGHAPESRDWRPWDPTHPPKLGIRVRVEAYVTIDAGLHQATTIGNHTWLMKGCHVGHDAIIGTDCELAPHCVVGGHVELGDNVRVGMGAIFKPRVKVGHGAVIGCGAVVICDVPAGETWAGNPARKLPSTCTMCEGTGKVTHFGAYGPNKDGVPVKCHRCRGKGKA